MAELKTRPNDLDATAFVDMDILHELIERSVADMKALEATDG